MQSLKKSLGYCLSVILLLLHPTLSGCNEFEMTNEPQAVQSAEITVKFLYFTPYRVVFSSTINNWTGDTPVMVSDRTYVFTYPNVTGNQLLSIEFSLYNPPPHEFDDTSWVNGGGGIRYADVYINGRKLGNEFAIDNGLLGSNISFTLDASGMPLPVGTPVNPDSRIPPEVFSAKRLIEQRTPPSDKPYIHGWLQVLHDNNYPAEPSVIKVKSMKLYKYVHGVEEPVLFYNYEYQPLSVFYDGGLYIRYPSFPPGDYHDPMTPYASINAQGILEFSSSERKDKVWHFWHEPRILFPADAYALRFECEMMIKGKCAVQAGLDFKSSTAAQGIESGIGDWYFESSQWQTVVFDSRQ